jgi:hypothetical protein
MLFELCACPFDQMQAHPGHARAHSRRQRPGIAGHRRRQQSDQHVAHGLALRVADVIHKQVGVSRKTGYARQDPGTKLGEHHSTAGANEQPLPALPLQVGDGSTDHRLRHGKRRGSLAQAARVNDTKEYPPPDIDHGR